MSHKNDFIRRASVFTMGGLIDPRLLAEPAKETSKAATTKKEGAAILTSVRAFFDSIFSSTVSSKN
jgi:hypothetical protein